MKSSLFELSVSASTFFKLNLFWVFVEQDQIFKDLCAFLPFDF